MLTHLVMFSFFDGASETAAPPPPSGDSGLAWGTGLSLGTGLENGTGLQAGTQLGTP